MQEVIIYRNRGFPQTQNNKTRQHPIELLAGRFL
jgi:hypothetical protein